jgi:heme/copper-type cytochrome/quinol oxidase subunit 2
MKENHNILSYYHKLPTIATNMKKYHVLEHSYPDWVYNPKYKRVNLLSHVDTPSLIINEQFWETQKLLFKKSKVNKAYKYMDQPLSYRKRKLRKNRKWKLRIPDFPTDVYEIYPKADNQSSLFDYTDTHNYRGEIFESDGLEVLLEPAKTTRVRVAKYPVRLVKGILNKHNLSILKSQKESPRAIFFNYRVNKYDVAHKASLVEPFWGFRQKKYKKMRYFSFPLHPKYNSITYTYVRNFLNNQPIKTYRLYTAIKNNKYKNELMPVTLARRLLRTKRTLVLPAHINITLITNSYDVIHSWFVPGLGLKIDCVPGRSTHHTLYIDNVGFYYGQCAEICGRYHHHMPIRVCALPYEHFMLWW